MKLTDLIRHLDGRVIRGTAEKHVKALIYFSEEAAEGSVFFAIPGAEKNGLAFAADAVNRGAHTVILEEHPGRRSYFGMQPADLLEILPEDVTIAAVADVRKALARASCFFYRQPCSRLLTVGITGTKGKTSTAYMLRAILKEAGIKTGLIGTVENGWDGSFQEADRTTPQSLDIQMWCRHMADHGCRAVVMEVSSQGLMQSRAVGMEFDTGIFTNLSPDHIGPGEHESFEDYIYWKSTLFQHCRTAVIWEDEPRWRQLMEMRRADSENSRLPVRVISFGRNRRADFICGAPQLLCGPEGPGTAVEMDGHLLKLGLVGTFNAENAAGAAAAARSLGIPWETIQKALLQVRIPGRVEPVDTGGRTCVLVDYAHNGTALRSLLRDLRAYTSGRLIVVFGCGGNRDRNRRFEMGRAAAELADYAVITSDNPRKENPQAILDDIACAVKEAVRLGAACSWRVIPDRAEAIRFAVEQGRKDDIILIAGKGHETWQIAGEKKIHFDDREAVRNIYGGIKP